MKLSIVIPAYNEEENIEKAVRSARNAFPSAQIVVVNDASTDNTLQILFNMKVDNLLILNNLTNRGHGYSVIYGLWHATGDSILYIDADRQIDIENFDRIPKENLFLYDVISGIRVHRNDKLFRKITSFCLKMTILIKYGYYIRDANCPFKIYKRESVRTLIKKLPTTLVIPIACLEVLARKEDMLVGIIDTPHKPYDGIRQGFLQVPNKTFFKFIGRAFMEIIKL